MAESVKLPPGSNGLPLVGETLPFLSDMFGFIRARTERHGPVFRSHILGHPTAFISGPEVCEPWLDENKIQRAGSFPAPVQRLFAGPGILPLLDGAEHRQRKELVMAAFRREALGRYFPALQTIIESALAAAPAGEVTPAHLRQMPYLEQVVMEVKRTCPGAPVSFGRARVPIRIGDVTIPAGWNVMMAVGAHNMNSIFTEPETFYPDRFGAARAEQNRHPHAFAPQGAGSVLGGHKCAGYDYSTVIMQLFTVLLARGYTWEIPPQDLSMNRALVPPEFKSGLRVVIRKV